MLTLPPAIAAQLTTGRFRGRYMLRMDLPTGATGVWGGDHPLTYSGVTYGPLGGAMLPSAIPGKVGLDADMLEVTVSGLDQTITAVINGANWHQRPAILSLAFLDDAGAVQHVHPVFAGYMDTLDTDSAADSTATVTLRLESNSRELGRSVGRVRNDADQRSVDSTDGFYRYVGVVAANPKIYWGRKGPQSPWG